jgi:hypothetical protein
LQGSPCTRTIYGYDQSFKPSTVFALRNALQEALMRSERDAVSARQVSAMSQYLSLISSDVCFAKIAATLKVPSAHVVIVRNVYYALQRKHR